MKLPKVPIPKFKPKGSHIPYNNIINLHEPTKSTSEYLDITKSRNILIQKLHNIIPSAVEISLLRQWNSEDNIVKLRKKILEDMTIDKESSEIDENILKSIEVLGENTNNSKIKYLDYKYIDKINNDIYKTKNFISTLRPEQYMSAESRAIRDSVVSRRLDNLQHYSEPSFHRESHGIPRSSNNSGIINSLRVSRMRNETCQLTDKISKRLKTWRSRDFTSFDPLIVHTKGRSYYVPEAAGLSTNTQSSSHRKPFWNSSEAEEIQKQYELMGLPWLWGSESKSEPYIDYDNKPLGNRRYYLRLFKDSTIGDPKAKLDQISKLILFLKQLFKQLDREYTINKYLSQRLQPLEQASCSMVGTTVAGQYVKLRTPIRLV